MSSLQKEYPRIHFCTAVIFLCSSSPYHEAWYDSTGFDILSTERLAQSEFQVINASPIDGCIHFGRALSYDYVKGQNIKYFNPEARLHQTRSFDRVRACSLFVSDKRSML